MSTIEKFKELKEKSKRVYEAAIQVNAKIESAEESLNRFLPILQERYGTSDLDELEKVLEKHKAENEKIYLEKSAAVETCEKKVKETSEILREIQNSMK